MRDLESRGFVVVRGMLSPGEVSRLVAAQANARPTDVTLYHALEPRKEDVLGVARLAEELLPEIRRVTRLRTDRVVPRGVIFSTEYTRLGWHTDFKSDYLFQGHRDHVTFWIPIEKPVRDRSGLSLVPLDRLREADARLPRLLEGKGAVRHEHGRIHFEEGHSDRSIPCPVKLDDLAESPALDAGDALLFRSDVLHRTADGDTRRVALALRALHGDHELSAWRLLSGSPGKRARMRAEPAAFCEVLGAFWLHRRSRITVAELLTAQERFARKEPLARLAFATARLALPPALLAGALAGRLSA